LIKDFGKKRFIMGVTLFIFFVAVNLLIWAFTSQSGMESNVISNALSKMIENVTSLFFQVNPNDYFWKETLNLILRKVGHFVEYMLLGMTFCAFLNVYLMKIKTPAQIAVVFCPTVAVLDEFRQTFVAGRTPRLFDIAVDTCGALLGIALVTVAFAVFWRMRSLEKRIKFLESNGVNGVNTVE
jgi:VanZ family protein